MHRPTAVQLAKAAAAGANAAISKEHKRFQQLLERIEKARQRLAAWQEQLPLFAKAHETQVRPLITRLSVLIRAWTLELEQLMLGYKWSKAEMQTLERMLADLVDEALEEAEGTDEELRALYMRLHGRSPEEAEAARLAEMKAMLEKTSGLDLGDEAPESMDDLMRRAQAGMQERKASQAREAGADPHNGKPEGEGDDAADLFGQPAQTGQRVRKARKPSAAQQRAQAEAARVTQTVKDVFRKLAAALHPDRAGPDASDEERALRGERMARANAAYAAGDLLALLTLQLQIEQVDLAQAAKLPDEQVRHFNRLLNEQLKELEADVGERERAFCQGYGYAPHRRPDPNKLTDWLKDEVRELQTTEARLKYDQRTLRSDPVGAKRLLKQIGAEMRLDDHMEELLFSPPKW